MLPAGSLLRRPYLNLFSKVMFALSVAVVLAAAVAPLRHAGLSTIVKVAAIYVPINAVTAYTFGRFSLRGRRDLELARLHRDGVERDPRGSS